MAGRNMGVFGPMAASMKEARLEGPVLGEVRPGVGSRGPAAVPQLKNHRSTKRCWGTLLVRSHLVRGMRRRALLVGNAAVAILLGIA